MYFVKTPKYLKAIFKNVIWDIDDHQSIYLTFDDGPTPGVTEDVLNILKQFNAKATFFIIGKNIKKQPAYIDMILKDDHAIGNHTYQHINGWKTDNEKYYADIMLCDELISSNLFRPPYGRITFQQMLYIKKKYKIIMWDVLSGDFDLHADAKTCGLNVINYATPGSIVVYHDSLKAKERILGSLPAALLHLSKMGFTFKSLQHLYD